MAHLRRIAPGTPLNGLSSGDWNTFIDSAKAVESIRRSGSLAPEALPQATLRVKNSTGSDIGIGAVLAIGSPLFGPGDNLTEFRFRSSYAGNVPDASTKGRVAIAVEPIKAGRVGHAAIAGLVVCKVDVTDATTDRASELAGQTDRLVTASNGPIRIVWRESGSSGQKWAAVALALAAPFVRRPSHRIASSTLVISGDTPQWRYTVQPVTSFASGSFGSSGTSLTKVYNLAEDQTDYQHGQSLTLANGSILTPQAVTGPVHVEPTGLFEGGEEIYTFDMLNPMEVACPEAA